MMADGHVVDGSWNLSILVTDLRTPEELEPHEDNEGMQKGLEMDVETRNMSMELVRVFRTVRVKGDLHIGGVMLKIVETFRKQKDWSDYGLWWPDKQLWLSRSRSTLDQYYVQADALLLFTPMHKPLQIQLPDLQIMDMMVDFSKNVFTAVVKICKELGIRHPEELSISRKLTKEELKKNKGISATRRERLQPPANSPSGGNWNYATMDGHTGTLTSSPRTPNTPQNTLLRTPGTPGSPFNAASTSPYLFNGTMSPGSINSLAFEGAQDTLLIHSPDQPPEVLNTIYRPKNFSEKARINAGWLDSSRSLMEQALRQNDLVLIRFKYFSFYDLNPKYDMIRINQIYEQAKWGLVSEEVDCTEEEMMMFAALQLQINMQAKRPQLDMVDGTNNHSSLNVPEDEIDSALNDLQVSLEGSSLSTASDIERIPKLEDELRFFKPKKFTIKSYKRYYFVFKDTYLSMFRSNAPGEDALMKANLRGCEVHPDVNISTEKYNMKLFVPQSDGMNEVWIRADTEDQYVRWMAAFKFASKGRTMADSSYEAEVDSIRAFLRMQHPAQTPTVDASQIETPLECMIASRFLKKLKSKQVVTRILDAHANVQNLKLLEAKMQYIKAWQALPEYGIIYFIVKFKSSKKEELVGIANNRMIRMDLHSGDSNKTWRFNNMRTWRVNWEIKQVNVEFEEENLAFQCLTADCKVVHEYIGGYIFLSMRSGEKNQSLNEELFHKLTGGWT